MFKDHFSGHAAAYAAARPDYPEALFAWLAQQAPARNTVWDCATGSGQAALALTEYFDAVHATDASSEQIANARAHEKIRYAVAPAEASGLPEASLDMITVAQAAHWFDLPTFYAEARRALKPRGVLAMWGYGLTRIVPAIDRVIDRFDAEIIGPYWPAERRHIDNAYRDIDFPFAGLPVPRFHMLKRWTLTEFLAYIGSWSAVQRYRKEKGSDPVVWLRRELNIVWSEADGSRDVIWPLFMLAGTRVGD
ncbi:MAG: class I SAM-dependent methyltransferase [Gammaproteobacteria bacterium]|nr:class I SAM-dependent methyltransferase [Gammaproteobacteria bacterium]